VVFFDWLLPGIEFELGVADVTLAQYEALAQTLAKGLSATPEEHDIDWARLLQNSMVSLDHLLKILPPDVNILFDLAYPSKTISPSIHSHRLNLNDFVHSVLQTIFDGSGLLNANFPRRKITFTSFCPDVCSALNWKQPNYPVFLGSICGRGSDRLPTSTAAGAGKDDRRVSSVGAAVEFAKANNLLGIFVDAELLVQVPSLVDGIHSAELLVGAYGIFGSLASVATGSFRDSSIVDAFIVDGVVSFVDNSMRELA
jgi:CDK inhibitor PHO81